MRSLHARVKNYTCLRNTTHRRIYVSTYIAFLRIVMLNFYTGVHIIERFQCIHAHAHSFKSSPSPLSRSCKNETLYKNNNYSL